MFQFFKAVSFIICRWAIQYAVKLDWRLSRGMQAEKRGIFCVRDKFIKLIVLLLFYFLFRFFPDSGDLVGPFTAAHNGKAYKIRIFLDDGLDSGLFGVFLLLIFQVNDDFRSPLFFIYRI